MLKNMSLIHLRFLVAMILEMDKNSLYQVLLKLCHNRRIFQWTNYRNFMLKEI